MMWKDRAMSIKDKLVELRREVHMNPELGFDLDHTTGLVASTLESLGVPFKVGVGKSGVVATLGQTGGKGVAVRADMDALPILEANPVPYASKRNGRMHACGHDAHTAMLLGVAMLLRDTKLDGQVHLLFQPSEEGADEEGLSGAQRMLFDGVMDKMNAVIALHVNNDLETGHISMNEGPVSAAVDRFKAWVLGKGSHGAYPHQSQDPIWMATQVLNYWYAIPSRKIDPTESAVLTVGIVQAGTASNIIPASAFLEGTMRSMSEETRTRLAEELKRGLEITRSMGGDYELKIDNGYPVLNNNPRVTSVIQAVVSDQLGFEANRRHRPGMGSEDFSYFSSVVPGAMFDLGSRKPGGEVLGAHTSTFDIDEDCLPIGVALLAESAARLLEQI